MNERKRGEETECGHWIGSESCLVPSEAVDNIVFLFPCLSHQI